MFYKIFCLLIHFYFSQDCCGLTPRNNIKQCMRILLNRIHTAIEATSTLKCSIDISKEVGFIPTLNFDFCIHFKSRVYLTCTLHHTFSLSLTYNKGPIGRQTITVCFSPKRRIESNSYIARFKNMRIRQIKYVGRILMARFKTFKPRRDRSLNISNFPAGTQRCFNIHLTLYGRYVHQMDVETIMCACWASAINLRNQQRNCNPCGS